MFRKFVSTINQFGAFAAYVAGRYVPYTGATTDVDLGTNTATGESWTSTLDYPASPLVGDMGTDVDTKTNRATDWWSDGQMAKYLLPNIAASTAINTTAAETDFSLTRTVPANALSVRRCWRERKAFTYGTTGTPTLRLRGYFGTNTYMDTTALTLDNNSAAQKIVSDLAFSVDSISGTTCTVRVSGFLFVKGATTLQMVPVSATFICDSTAALTWKWSAQWGTSSLSNTITMDQDWVQT